MANNQIITNILNKPAPIEIVWGTTFDGSIAEMLNLYESGSGVLPTYVSTKAEFAPGCMLLNMGATTGGISGTNRYFAGLPKTKIGFQTSIQDPIGVTTWQFELGVNLYDGLNQYAANLRVVFNLPNLTTYYRNSSGGYNVLSEVLQLPYLLTQFYPLKMVIDASQTPPVYDHFEIGGKPENEINGMALYLVASSTRQPTVLIDILGVSLSSTSTKIHVGHFLYTINEP